jgi:4-amino-4-deoxy-L-arabinose transferase-like glycosyltransferase
MTGPTVALAAILVAFLALTSVIAIGTPAWESADEPGHVDNIEHLVAGHWYHIPIDNLTHQVNRGNERHQPPLYYLIMAGIQRLEGEPAQPVSPGIASFPLKSNSRGQYLHHSAAQHRFLLLLRLPNLIFGVLTIIFTFLTARLITNDRWTPVIAAAICGLLPRLVFLSAFVTNDNLVTALGAILVYCSLRCMSSATLTRTIPLGIVCGLIVLAKLTALPALAVLAVVILAQPNRRERLKTTAILGAFAMLTCGWWLVHNQVVYGDPLAIRATHRYLVAIFGLGTLAGPYTVSHPLHLIFVGVPDRIFRDFWYQSGWNQFTWPTRTGTVYWIALLAALVGLLRPTRRSTRRPQLVALIVLAGAGLLTVWLAAFTTAVYEPRLGLYAIPALACLAALGLERWHLPVRLVLPAMELIGVMVAIQQNVLSVHWY